MTSSTGRPVARSMRLAQLTCTKGSATSTSPRRPVEGVGKAVLVEMDQRLAACARDGQVREDDLGVGVVVPVVVRRELVGPHQRAIARPARQHAGGPLVVARALLGVVGRGVAGAVVDEIELGVVGQPAPHRRAAVLPGVAGPAGERRGRCPCRRRA